MNSTRHMNRRQVIGTSLGAGALAVMTPALAGAAPANTSRPAAVTAQDGSQVVIGAWTEPPTLLSGAPVNGASYQQIQRIIANGLVRLGYPAFEVEPDLAESWDISEDNLVHTFHLREGVTWHDGEPFTANDVKFTYDVVTDPEWPGGLDSYFAQIAGAIEHKDGTAGDLVGVKVIDDYTVEVTLIQPDALFLSSAASRQRILPKHILESVSPADIDKNEFARKPIYTGAYIVEEWRDGESITFRANENYFEGKPGIDTIVARFIADAATANNELSSGGLDIGVVPPDLLAAYEQDSNFTIRELPGLRIVYIQLDTTLPVFNDARVRQAISHAIDKQTVIDANYLGKGEVGRSFVTPLAWIFNPDAPQYGYDVDAANALLDEAGWTVGDDGVRVNADGQRLAFTLSVPTAYRMDGLVIQPFLQEVGIEVTIEELGAGQVTGPLAVGEFEATISNWNNFIIDPRADLQRHFQSPRAVDYSGYTNEEVEQLFVEARSELDQEAEKAMYFEIQNLIDGDAPYIYLWRVQDLLVINNQRLNVPETASLAELYARIPEWQLVS